MPHGERAKRLADNSTRDYWQRRHGNNGCNGRPTSGHADPLSHKRLTRRAERRIAKQRKDHDA